MPSIRMKHALLGLLGTPLLLASGCAWPFSTTMGPVYNFPWPVPISPYNQADQETRHWVNERYRRVPIMGPITSGGPVMALDPPSDDEIMRALEEIQPVAGGVPLLWTRQRNNVKIVVEPIADYVDPPRFIPLVGPAQVHHAHYKCTVYYTNTTHNGYPLPYTTVDQDSREVVYIDHNHLHVVGDVGDYGLQP